MSHGVSTAFVGSRRGEEVSIEKETSILEAG
jgi:hypothetical protein